MLLAWPSLAFLFGLLAGSWLPPVPGWIVVPGALILSGLYPLRHSPWRSVPLVVAAGLFGLLRAGVDGGPPSPHDVAYYLHHRVTVVATIAQEPDVRLRSTIYTVQVESLSWRGRILAARGTLLVRLAPAQQYDQGERLQLTGVVGRGEVWGHGRVPEMRYPVALDRGEGFTGWQAAVIGLRRWLTAGIDTWLPEPEAALLVAIALGARSSTLGTLAPVLVHTGLIHIVAISGIKVALVAGTVWEMSKRFLHRWLALTASLCLLWSYVVLTGLTASGTRSALMWTMVMLSVALGRGTVSLLSLSLVIAMMAALDPTLPWNAGFQLSALGTGAIIAFNPILTEALRWVPSPLREAITTTISAQIGTLPIAVLTFHVVTFAGPLANMLVLPLLPLLIVLGFGLGAASGLSVLSLPLAALADALLRTMILGVKTLDVAYLDVSGIFRSPPPWSVYYLGVAVLALYALRRAHFAPVGMRPALRSEFAVASACAVIPLTVMTVLPARTPPVRLTWLGSGTAVLLQSNGQTALIGGSADGLGLLDALGATLPFATHSLDAVVVTDPRASSVSGLVAVLAHYRVGEVLDVGSEYPSTTYARWRATLRTHQIPTFSLRTGTQIHVGSVQVSTTAPEGLRSDPRDCIGTVLVRGPHGSVLVEGAASLEEQREAAVAAGTPHARVVVLDGLRGVDSAFLARVDPATLYTAHSAQRGTVPLGTAPRTIPL